MIQVFNDRWKREYMEGLRKAPLKICPRCGKKTRMRKTGRFHCRFCKIDAQFPRVS